MTSSLLIIQYTLVKWGTLKGPRNIVLLSECLT